MTWDSRYNRQNPVIYRDRNVCCVSFISVFDYDINASNRGYKNRNTVQRATVNRKNNYNILVSILPALGAIKNKEQRKSLCHLQVFLLLYVLFTFFYDLWEIKSWQYGCVVLIFCVDLIWCIRGLYQEYVPKFGTHRNEKSSQKKKKKTD